MLEKKKQIVSRDTYRKKKKKQKENIAKIDTK